MNLIAIYIVAVFVFGAIGVPNLLVGNIANTTIGIFFTAPSLLVLMRIITDFKSVLRDSKYVFGQHG